MIKRNLASVLVVASLALGSGSAAAAEASRETVIGLGAGATAGALVGGPLGLGIGAILGAVVGDKVRAEDALVKQNAHHRAELASLESELADLRQDNGGLRAESRRLSRELAQLAELRESHSLSGTLTMDVLFRTGSDRLEPAARQRLDALSEALKRFPSLQVRLEGHADIRGEEEANLELSARRIEAVRSLLAEAGVPLERIESVALGEAEARAERGDADGLALDRRVAIELRMDPPADERRELGLKL